jgi:hypothetical protein
MRDAGARRGRGRGQAPLLCRFVRDKRQFEGRASAHGCPAAAATQAERDRVSREEVARGGLEAFHEGTVVRALAAGCLCACDAPPVPNGTCTVRARTGRPGRACSTSIVGVALLHHSPMVPLFIMQSRATTDPAIQGIRTDFCAKPELWSSKLPTGAAVHERMMWSAECSRHHSGTEDQHSFLAHPAASVTRKASP